MRILLLAVSTLLFSSGAVAQETPEINDRFPDLIQDLTYRMIGPYRGGRVTAVTGIREDVFTYYMGSTGGGVWKTDDGGTSWKNVSDKYFSVGSIGSVAVAPSDPNVVYVGTGSAAPRGNVSPGAGMYKSTDAGKTWTSIGLIDAGQIGKVVVHPEDPQKVYAAALGNVFGPNPERGVFRSENGGQSWEKVLFVSDSTGCIDLEIDPTNPRILYAGMWRVERKPWTLIDGGIEGGVWKTTDGGATWEKLSGGLPDGRVGKVGIAASAAKPGRVWVIQEAEDEKKGGLYLSDDGGKSFSRVNRSHELRQRAWYYSYVIADPQDANTVYVLNGGMHLSTDAGKSFERVRTPHGDNHDLWINPDHPEIMIESNDGGANVSFNGGTTWSTQLNQPTAEFYRVTVDTQFPYRVYGAQQDNTTLSIPSDSPGGITPKEHWYAVGGGESGHIAVDPRNPDIIYAGNYIGQITRYDRSRGHSRDIVAYPQMHDGVAPRDITYRFQWNAPIRLSRHNPDILYHTSQYVHRSIDGGQTWEVISPDLTTNNDRYHDLPGGPIQHDHTGVELYTTIFAFEESPVQAGLLWVGSDDGRLHISTDAGDSWKDITPDNFPFEGTVNSIDPSPHDPARATIAVYKYRENDFRPFIYQTDDFGMTWSSLSDGKNGIPQNHFVRVVREDPVQKGLLYAGTEFGMYISFDNGDQWHPFQLNLPRTPITDLVIHQNDLVVATQGRSFWILDDLTPLRGLANLASDSRDLILVDPATAYRTQIRGFRGGEAPESAPAGAIIDYFVDEMPGDSVDVRLEILGLQGQVVRTFSTRPDSTLREEKLKVKKGHNRFVWDLKYESPDLVDGSFMSLAYTGGYAAPVGRHGVRVRVDDEQQDATFEVQKDPRWDATVDDLMAQYDLTQKVLGRLNDAHSAVRTIRSVRKQVENIQQLLGKSEGALRLKPAADSVLAHLEPIEEALIQTRNESGQDPINYPPKLDDQIAYLYSIVNGQDARPNNGAYRRFDDVSHELQRHEDALQRVLETYVKRYMDLLEQENVGRIIVPDHDKE